MARKKPGRGKRIHLDKVKAELKRVRGELQQHKKTLEADAKQDIDLKIELVKKLLDDADACAGFKPT